jgi:hypothetical protein
VMDALGDLLRKVDVPQAGQAAPTFAVQYGVVAAVSPALTVTVGGSTVATPAVALEPYAPAVGDYVATIDTEGARLVLGRVGTALPRGSWQTWTPTVGQGIALTGTLSANAWRYDGDMIEGVFRFAITGGGTGAGSRLDFTLPVAANPSTVPTIGHGSAYDVATSYRYVCSIELVSSTVAGFSSDGVSTNFLGISPSVAFGNTDSCYARVRYRWR